VERADLDSLTLEYEESGAGEPVVCIHGAFIADTFRPFLAEFGRAGRYRLISYHRRGYVGSSPAHGGASFETEADDCRKLLAHLGVERANVVGHSSGGAIGLRLALDAPEVVHTLTLLEAALVIGESADQYRQALVDSMRRFREGDAHAAVDAFLENRWPGFRQPLERALPGAYEQALTDAETCFTVDIPAAASSRFGPAEARRIAQPVLVVLGEKSVDLSPRYAETYRLLLDWLPNAEGYVLPRSTHFLQVQNPHDMAEALGDFLARHPLDDSALERSHGTHISPR
jgi:pimeloyl-ACP methyl ester carboxylesterase